MMSMMAKKKEETERKQATVKPVKPPAAMSTLRGARMAVAKVRNLYEAGPCTSHSNKPRR